MAHLNARFPVYWRDNGDLIVVQVGAQEAALYDKVNVTNVQTKVQYLDLWVTEVMACKAEELSQDYFEALTTKNLDDFLSILSRFYGTVLPKWSDVVIYTLSNKAPKEEEQSEEDVEDWYPYQDDDLEEDEDVYTDPVTDWLT